MKRTFFLLLAGAMFLLQACEKTEYVKPGPQLEFTVVTDNVVIVEGAVVTLYNTQQDWEQETNAVDSQQTGSAGKALFTNLQEQKYYFMVKKDELNNLADIAATHDPLVTGRKSELLVKIMKTSI